MNRIIIPRVLECARFLKKSNSKSERMVKDYELDFYVDGKREMWIDGKKYDISTGSLVFRVPGQRLVSYGDYNCYVLTIDLSGSVAIEPSQYSRTHTGDFQTQSSHILLQELPTVFTPKHFKEICALYEKLNTCTYPFPENIELQNACMKELLLLIAADAAALPIIKKTENMQSSYVNRACEYMEQNYQQDITIKTVSDRLSLNHNYFIRLFKEKTGSTPNKYLNEVRLFYARNMLIESSFTTSEIASSCGFCISAYFIKCFKKRFGKTPGDYRLMARKQI